MAKKYIKGKDGKFNGSLPDPALLPKLSNSASLPKLPPSLNSNISGKTSGKQVEIVFNTENSREDLSAKQVSIAAAKRLEHKKKRIKSALDAEFLEEVLTIKNSTIKPKSVQII